MKINGQINKKNSKKIKSMTHKIIFIKHIKYGKIKLNGESYGEKVECVEKTR